MYAKNSNVYRVVFIGDSSVGKTSIISRLVSNTYNSNEQTTVGAMFVIYSETVKNERIEMQIWDTAGQEKFRSLGPIYYRSAQVGIIVADVTNINSFEHLDEWVDSFRKIAGSDALLVVAGNKADMGDERQVSNEAMDSWAAANGIKWFLTSAKDGSGIHDMIHFIANYLYENRTTGLPTSTATPQLQEKTPNENGEKKSCC